MKHITSLLLFTLSIGFAQTPCENGTAGGYPCDGYDLQAHIPFTTMGASNANDSWGWTDPQDGKEYAIVGLNNGTAFIDISDPVNPVHLGNLPTATGVATARDIKTYQNVAYVVSDNNGAHGMQVFDLTRLRDVGNPPVTFTMDNHYTEFNNAHNLAINEDSGFAYALRTNTFGGGAHFIDLQDPLNPVAAGGVSGIFSHDAQIVTYQGPDTDYTGSEILVSYNGFDQDVTIVDVTDKNNPTIISNFGFTSSEHAHQGWFTEDQRYIIMGDESDELNLGLNTRSIVFDASDLDNPFQDFEYFSSLGATDHNGYVLGDTYYLASYNAGMRVLDISDIQNGVMTETGYFDVFPSNNSSGFSGAWSVYPYFESGNIIISALGSGGGFFLVRENTLGASDFDELSELSIYPNPASETINIAAEETGIHIKLIQLFDQTGRLLLTSKKTQSIDISALSPSIVLLTIETDKGIVTKKVVIE